MRRVKYEFKINKGKIEGKNNLVSIVKGETYSIIPPENFKDLGCIMAVKGLVERVIEDGLKFKKEFYMSIFSNNDIEITKTY